MDPVILRAIERIGAVAVGGLAIYLGFRLFRHMPSQGEDEGRFTLPGGVSIYISRVGPGTFFALFGSVLVTLSFIHAVSYRQAPGAKHDAIEYRGVEDEMARVDSQRLDRLKQVRLDLAYLNRALPRFLSAETTLEGQDFVQALHVRVKLALLHTVWSEDWDSFDAFERWVRDGAPSTTDSGLREAVELFHYQGG